MAAILGLDLCMRHLRLQQLKADRAGFGALTADAMSDRLPGVLGHQGLELALRSLVIDERLAGFAEKPGELAPGIRAAHVDDTDSLDARSRRFRVDQVRCFAGLHTAPEF